MALPPRDEARRAAATLQRPHRLDESRRAAAGTARVRELLPDPRARLRRAVLDAARAHRARAGPRPVRLPAREQAALRPRLPVELVAVARPVDPAADRAHRHRVTGGLS